MYHKGVFCFCSKQVILALTWNYRRAVSGSVIDAIHRTRAIARFKTAARLAEYHNTSWAREIYDAARKMTTKALSLTWCVTLSRAKPITRRHSGENGKQRLFWQFHTRALGNNF
jgi:hypothetical protein